ncbi:hypothetical protein B0H15DRAFT_841951 [Mycena belliarum]|uniref:Short-chain dehydrogenase/reductase n=1 Tax=Mycena belliarum TaxID=1033014 RepID=A0AAD6U808_9AGAR|nr:hypothetical protein B0H15DRAFT_841951 [Mycena belliae]
MSLPTFSLSTTAEEVADVFQAEIQGKNVLVTGTSLSGLGFETARTIAKYANLVIITGYNAERLKLSKAAIEENLPSANIRCLTLDLSSLAAVRKAAAEVNAYSEPLHVLIHNAATAFGPFKLTVDNLENLIATNHVGPFLLTKLLAPKLLDARTPRYTPRVIFVSSASQTMITGIDFGAMMHPDAATYKSFETYGQTKSANSLTAIELSRRSGGRLNAYSLDPGIIMTKAYEKGNVSEQMKVFGVLDAEGQPNTKDFQWKTIPQGAATTVTAAFDTRLNDKPGAYLLDCVVAELPPHSSDPANAEKLWTVTEEIIGEKFTF